MLRLRLRSVHRVSALERPWEHSEHLRNAQEVAGRSIRGFAGTVRWLWLPRGSAVTRDAKRLGLYGTPQMGMRGTARVPAPRPTSAAGAAPYSGLGAADLHPPVAATVAS